MARRHQMYYTRSLGNLSLSDPPKVEFKYSTEYVKTGNLRDVKKTKTHLFAYVNGEEAAYKKLVGEDSNKLMQGKKAFADSVLKKYKLPITSVDFVPKR